MAPKIEFPTEENERAVLGVLVVDKTKTINNDHECGCGCDCPGCSWSVKVTNN